MSRRFRYFVMLADMRTGSNFLEENLRLFPDISSHGELFNPHFVGKAGQDTLFGMTLAERDADPIALLDAMIEREGEGIAGFRLFHDHDRRVIDHVLGDPNCGKIVLTRNPLQSYVSLKIAGETGQWRMGDVRKRKSARISFDAEEFEDYLQQLQDFQVHILKALQHSGQTAFYIHYDDLQDLDTLNGLGVFLGSSHRVDTLARNIKPQNPDGLESKVSNHREMARAIAGIDFMDLGRTPNFEPRRGPGVPGYVAGNRTRLLFIPVRGVAEAEIRDWLAECEGNAGMLAVDFNQKTLRQWKRDAPNHVSFTVVSHPVERAWNLYAAEFGDPKRCRYPEIRRILTKRFAIPFPDTLQDDAEALRNGFIAFLTFLKANLSDQTNVRVNAAWASQTAQLEGAARVSLPHHILRADRMQEGLACLARAAGLGDAPQPRIPQPAPGLSRVYSEAVESAAREAYHRDYLSFGFGDWAPRG